MLMNLLEDERTGRGFLMATCLGPGMLAVFIGLALGHRWPLKVLQPLIFLVLVGTYSYTTSDSPEVRDVEGKMVVWGSMFAILGALSLASWLLKKPSSVAYLTGPVRAPSGWGIGEVLLSNLKRSLKWGLPMCVAGGLLGATLAYIVHSNRGDRSDSEATEDTSEDAPSTPTFALPPREMARAIVAIGWYPKSPWGDIGSDGQPNWASMLTQENVKTLRGLGVNKSEFVSSMKAMYMISHLTDYGRSVMQQIGDVM